MKSPLNPTKAVLALGFLSLIALPVFAADDDNTPFNRSDQVDEVVEDRAVEKKDTQAGQQDQTVQERQDQTAQTEEDQVGPVEDVREAANVLQEMQTDPDMRRMLDDAQGVFVIPDYVTAALIIGGSGGEGVLFTRDNGEWSNPAFYDIGEIDVGAQAGVSAGSIAMVLASEAAINNFKEDNNFALNADAGYSIVNWSDRAQAEVGMDSDVIVWTDTQGLLGELSVGVTGISFDEEENQEYYGQQASAEEILDGNVQDPQEQMLQQALREQ